LSPKRVWKWQGGNDGRTRWAPTPLWRPSVSPHAHPPRAQPSFADALRDLWRYVRETPPSYLGRRETLQAGKFEQPSARGAALDGAPLAELGKT
jgi:hypothetical protein